MWALQPSALRRSESTRPKGASAFATATRPPRGSDSPEAQRVDLDREWPEVFPTGWHKIRGFSRVFERDADQPAAIVAGMIVGGTNIEFQLDGVSLGRLAGFDSGRDRRGVWVGVRPGEDELDSGVPVRIEPSYDEFTRSCDGVEVNLWLRQPGYDGLTISFNLGGGCNGGGLPSRPWRPDAGMIDA